MLGINWNQLASEDPVPCVHFDVDTSVAFCFYHGVPYLDSAFTHVRSKVEQRVREYYDSSLDRSPPVVNTSTMNVPFCAPSVSSQLVVSSTAQSIIPPATQPIPTGTVGNPLLILSSQVGRFRPVVHSLFAPSVSIWSSPLIAASAAFSSSSLGYSAVTAGLVLRPDISPMVTAFSPVPPIPSSRCEAFVAVHDFDDGKYKTALDMMRAKRENATRLAAHRFAEMKNALAELVCCQCNYPTSEDVALGSS